jgi:hypothetical protein
MMSAMRRTKGQNRQRDPLNDLTEYHEWYSAVTEIENTDPAELQCY